MASWAFPQTTFSVTARVCEMLPILFHPQAAIEASIAADWYELQQPGLGDRFENDLQTTARSIQANPLIYAIENHREQKEK